MEVEASVYTIERKDGKTLVRNIGGKVIYSSPDEGYIIRRADDGTVEVLKVKDLSDTQLLAALASSVKIAEL